MEEISPPVAEKPIAAPPSPVVDIVAAPHEPPKDIAAPEKPSPKEEPKDKPKKAKAERQPGNGVGAAIFATVIIVFGLAAMATYAYLQTQK